MVGFSFLFQQTPLAVTGDPPSLIIIPPLINELEVTNKMSVVVIAGAESTSAPGQKTSSVSTFTTQ